MDEMKINKVQIRNLQMADYEQLAQSFKRVYADGSDVFWTRGQIAKLIKIFLLIKLSKLSNQFSGKK